MAVLSITLTKRGTKLSTFAFVLIVAMFSPNVASATPCEDRPTEADLRILTDRVKEGIIDRNYWYDDVSIPQLPTKVIVGISPVPVARFDGANVIAIVPDTEDVSFWTICGNEFSFKEGEGLIKGDLNRIEKDRYRSYFDNNAGAKTSEVIIRFDPSPDFGPLDNWKEGMLEKIQNNLACFFARNNAHLFGRSTISLHIGEFNTRSGGVLVAIPELDDLWTLGFQLNSEGVPNDIGYTHEQKLKSSKKILRDRLYKNSFVRNVELKCLAR